MARFVAQTGVTFPVGWDRSFSYGQLRVNPGLSPFPVHVIVDQAGIIRYVASEYDAEAIAQIVDALLPSAGTVDRVR